MEMILLPLAQEVKTWKKHAVVGGFPQELRLSGYACCGFRRKRIFFSSCKFLNATRYLGGISRGYCETAIVVRLNHSFGKK